MPAVTVTEIIQRARDAADMRDNFPTQAEFLRWLNVEHRRLVTRLARLGYVLQWNTQTITATGALGYSITDALAVLGVYELRDGRWRRLTRGDLQDGAGHVSDVAFGPATEYTIAQSADALTVLFYPWPTSGTYKVMTINQPAAVGLSDSITLPANLEEWLVLRLALRAVAKEEGDTGEIRRQLKEEEAEMEAFAWGRDLGAGRVRNVDRVERGWADNPVYSDPASWYWV